MHVQHVTFEGLATAGGIQGSLSDATNALLKVHYIEPIVKWVDDFIFFRCPLASLDPLHANFTFNFDLSKITCITEPLGIPWHPITQKGHKFQSAFSYVSFKWDLNAQSVCLP